jgi:polysaccharide biosynthesis/export protein
MRRLLTLIVMAVLLVNLTGCFSAREKDIEAFLMPDNTVVTARDYVLMPPDEIEIHCEKIPEIHLQKQRIRPDGYVTFENLGSVQAAGKTPEEVSDILRTKALELYALAGDKPIDIRITMYHSKVYYVLGEVERPGPKEYTGRDTALTAIAEAGITTLSWEQRIQVVRPSCNKNERPEIFELDFKKMTVHGDTSKNVLLQEGDIIYVPPTILASIGRTVQEIVAPISSSFTTVTVVQRALVGPASTQSGP